MPEQIQTDNPNSPNPIPAAQNPPQSRRNKVWFILIPLLLIVFAFAFLFLNKPAIRSLSNDTLVSNKTQKEEALDPIPFVEMTIPYLREQKYESVLSDLTTFSDNDGYSSYLTSYTSEGLKINGLLTRPKGDEPENGWPAIVFIHGYIPPTQYVTQEKYVDYVDYLARNGFVVFKIDLRGHGESDGEPGGGYYGSDYVTDALHARAALQKATYVNPDAVGMWGHSMAGNIIMRSMAVKPEIPAGVIWAGAVYSYTDQRKYGINDASYMPNQTDPQRQSRRRELFEKHGSPSAESVFWKQVAPVNYLRDLKGAVEIHHAIDDDVVPIGYSRDLVASLSQTSVAHALYEYDSGGHNISGTSFNSAMQRTVEFFTKYLKT